MHFLIVAFISVFLPLHAAEVTVLLVKGSVTVNGKEVSKGQILNEGEEINAQGPKNVVQLSFADGSRMLLRDGVMKLKKAKAPEQTFIQLVRGTLFSEKAKGKGSLDIETSHATLGVRGTKFFVQEDKSTYLCVCEGEVEISNGSSKEVLGKREDATVKSGEKFTKARANDMMWDIALAGFKEMQ